MAVDYTFVGIVVTFIASMSFMTLALEKRECPNAAIYHFLSAIFFFELSIMFLIATATSTVGLRLWMLFFGMGLINFVFFFIWVVQMFNIAKIKKLADKEARENE